MNKSDQINELAAALVIAQPTFKPALMDSVNPFFKSKYADLGAVWDAVQEGLTANGLTVTQFPDAIGSDPALTTILLHKSGQWISATYPLIVSYKDESAQGYGSAITYAKRYALAAVLGVIADTDDDGNAASKPPKPSSTTAPLQQSTQDKPAGKTTPAAWAADAIATLRTLKGDEATKWFEANMLILKKLKITEPQLHMDIANLVIQREQLQ